MSVKCPNCQTKLRVGLFRIEQSKKQTFQSVMPDFRGGLVGELQSLIWHLKGNKYRPPVKRFVIQSEIKTSKHQILINEYEIEANEFDLRQLAIVYVSYGLSWSRANSTTSTRVTQTTHLKVQEAFLRLGFLEQLSSTQYTLTDAGYRFLRHFASEKTINGKQTS